MAKRKTNRLLIYSLIGIAVILLILVIIKAKNTEHGTEVETEEVVTRTIHETVSASGKVFPEKEVKISSDVSGEVVELYVEEGDSVVTGQLLAKIDPEAYLSAVERGAAAVNNAKSNLAMQESSIQSSIAQTEQIQAQLDNARSIHERNKKLLDDGVISTQDYEASLANLQQLEANLKSAKASHESAKKAAEAAGYSVRSAEASLKEIRTNLSKTTISAPTNGIISRLSIEEGERVVGTIQMAGTEMMRIANFNTMEVQVEVSEIDILRVALGDTADIEVDAYLEETFRGVVTEIANSAANTGTGSSVVLTSDQVTNFIVKIRIIPESYAKLATPARPIPFRPGMSATVDIYTETVKDAISVPIQAVTTRDFNEDSDDEDAEEDEREVVFVMDADTARRVEITTGIQDNEYIEVKEGLEVGQTVVTGPYSTVSRRLEAGDNLRKKEEKKDEDKEEE